MLTSARRAVGPTFRGCEGWRGPEAGSGQASRKPSRILAASVADGKKVVLVEPLIERGIKPVCDALNAMADVRTLWSCEGHYTHSRPYVAFEAPFDVAQRIHQALVKATAEHAVRYCWRLTARFQDETGQLQWLIELESRIPRWRYLMPLRKPIDAELWALASVVALAITQEGS